MTECEHGQSLDQPCAECGRTGPSEPDPPTPEELFTLQRENWFDMPFDYKRAPHEVIDMLDALRDMIDSDRAEVARLTETVNRQDRVFTEFVNSTATDFREVAERLLRREGREELIAPETVAVPLSLVDALAAWCQGTIKDVHLIAEYGAWKTGKR